MSSVIRLQDVTKSYFLGEEEVHAVSGINLSIQKKEYISILGSSGSGKSTLMHMIGLLDSPTSGKIFLNDQDISKLSDDELSMMRNNNVGFVFQQFNLINKFTVLENVILPAKYTRSKLDFDPVQRAEELLKRFGIYDRRNFYPNKISGGQQQRVAVARALIMKPQIILADEPTGNLDSKTGDEIMDLLESLNKETGVTVVIVTHEREIAARTRKQIFIRDGKVVDKYL